MTILIKIIILESIFWTCPRPAGFDSKKNWLQKKNFDCKKRILIQKKNSDGPGLAGRRPARRGPIAPSFRSQTLIKPVVSWGFWQTWGPKTARTRCRSEPESGCGFDSKKGFWFKKRILIAKKVFWLWNPFFDCWNFFLADLRFDCNKVFLIESFSKSFFEAPAGFDW